MSPVLKRQQFSNALIPPLNSQYFPHGGNFPPVKNPCSRTNIYSPLSVIYGSGHARPPGVCMPPPPRSHALFPRRAVAWSMTTGWYYNCRELDGPVQPPPPPHPHPVCPLCRSMSARLTSHKWLGYVDLYVTQGRLHGLVPRYVCFVCSSVCLSPWYQHTGAIYTFCCCACHLAETPKGLWYQCLCICLSVCLCVRLSVCPSVCLSLSLSRSFHSLSLSQSPPLSISLAQRLTGNGYPFKRAISNTYRDVMTL